MEISFNILLCFLMYFLEMKQHTKFCKRPLHFSHVDIQQGLHCSLILGAFAVLRSSVPTELWNKAKWWCIYIIYGCLQVMCEFLAL